jgi:hypothetical protein
MEGVWKWLKKTVIHNVFSVVPRKSLGTEIPPATVHVEAVAVLDLI